MIKIGDLYEGQIRFNKSGSAYLVNEDLPKDIYIHKKNTGRSLHLDTVEVEVIKGNGDREIEGRVIEVIKRFKTQFVGTMEITDRFAFFIPDSPKMPVDIFVPLSKLNDAKDGQKVIVKLTRWRNDAKNPNGQVTEVLGDAGDNDVEIHSILHEYNLPYNFPEEVEDEANKISLNIPSSEIKRRLDLRGVTTICIDPLESRDKDDVISIKTSDGGFEVGVHIADVSHYVKPGTELDKEAFKRGNSVYLVDRVVPMFPERLSNKICSLHPNEDKLCFSVIFKLDSNYNIISEWFGRTVIHVDKDYTYEEAQEIIERGNPATHKKRNIGTSSTINNEQLCANAIIKLDEIAKTMRCKRDKNNSLTFNNREVKFKLDENAKPIGVFIKVQKDSNKLIEEFMLLANRMVSEFINKKGVNSIDRIHESPDVERLRQLKEFVIGIGLSLDISDEEKIKSNLNDLIQKVKGTPHENIINNLIIRSMQKAKYSVDYVGHYGLGFDHYTHFTSCIRRYSDLLVHRILGETLPNKGYLK